MAGPGGYAAFISYSSHDGAFARRLHKAIEGYRVPPGAGSFNLAGKPNRVAPVFLDRAELSSGELGTAIASAIENSTALIVICSPHAAKSGWVDKEIRHFVRTGRVRRIFAIIASGEPFASSHGAADNECFPNALRDLASGKLGDRHEVVAGDARQGKDGFRNAWLKVAAGILDVGFGKLLDRDAAARRGRTLLLGSTAAVAAAVVGTLTTFWFLESQRYQNEARSSLLREARSAFELDDSSRALAALASILPGMPAEGRVAYEAVLNAWSPRFPHFAASLANAPPVFAHEDRVFVKTQGGIVASPLAANMVIASGPARDAVFAIDFSGRVRQWRPGETEAQDLGLPADELGQYDWTSALKLNSGGVVFGGSVQSSYAGGAEPVLLLVNESARTHTVVPLGYFEPESLRLAGDCSALAFEGGSLELEAEDLAEPDQLSGIHVEERFFRFDFQGPSGRREPVTAEIFDNLPPLDPGPDSDGFGQENALDAIAAVCGGTVQGVPPSLKMAKNQVAQDSSLAEDSDPEDAGPNDSGIWKWVVHDIWTAEPKPDGPEVARIGELTDAIQRARLEIGETTRIRDGAPDAAQAVDFVAEYEAITPQEIAETVSSEFAARLGVYLYLDGADPTLAFYAAEGKSTGWNVCGFAGDNPRCINSIGWRARFAPFADFIYVGGLPYMGLPAFTLIDRKTLNAVEFRSDESRISEAAYAGSVALSPSGKQLAIAYSRTILLFDLTDRLAPKLSKRLSAPGLAAETGEGLMPVCAALTYLDEGTLVASRGDGLNLKLDLGSGEELWRFRLPASVGCDNEYVPVQAMPLDGGNSIAVRGSDFVAVLDTQTGLPLLPPATFNQLTRWEDDGVYSDEVAAQMAGDYEAGSPAKAPDDLDAGAGDNEFGCMESGIHCKSTEELQRSARNLAKISEPVLDVLPSGELLVRTETSLITLPTSPAGQSAVAISSSPQCFTGWRVAGSRIEPFDLMKDVKIGAPPVPEADLLAQCR